MAFEFARNVRDAGLQVVTALPAQNANSNTASIDLKVQDYRPENVDVVLSIPATPSLASGQTLIAKLQQSTDNSTFTDVTAGADSTITGGASGGAATDFHFRLPPDCARYIRFNIAMSATAGDNTAVSSTFGLRF